MRETEQLAEQFVDLVLTQDIRRRVTLTRADAMMVAFVLLESVENFRAADDEVRATLFAHLLPVVEKRLS